MSKLRLNKRKFILSDKKKVNPKKRFFVDDTVQPLVIEKGTKWTDGSEKLCTCDVGNNGRSHKFTEGICRNVCPHLHKDAPKNAMCEDCLKSLTAKEKTSGNSDKNKMKSQVSKENSIPLVVETKGLVLDKTENPDIMWKCKHCQNNRKIWVEKISKQTAEEIFKDFDKQNFTAPEYYEIKKKYLGELK